MSMKKTRFAFEESNALIAGLDKRQNLSLPPGQPALQFYLKLF